MILFGLQFPNNPTGTFITISTLERFLAKLDNNILVVLDEAYIEYLATVKSISLLDKYHNLILEYFIRLSEKSS